MATNSSILVLRIPVDTSAGGYSPWGHKEADPTEQLGTTQHIYTHFCFAALSFPDQGRNLCPMHKNAVLTTGLQAKSSPVILNLIRNDKESSCALPNQIQYFCQEKKNPSISLAFLGKV